MRWWNVPESGLEASKLVLHKANLKKAKPKKKGQIRHPEVRRKQVGEKRSTMAGWAPRNLGGEEDLGPGTWVSF